MEWKKDLHQEDHMTFFVCLGMHSGDSTTSMDYRYTKAEAVVVRHVCAWDVPRISHGN